MPTKKEITELKKLMPDFESPLKKKLDNALILIERYYQKDGSKTYMRKLYDSLSQFLTHQPELLKLGYETVPSKSKWEGAHLYAITYLKPDDVIEADKANAIKQAHQDFDDGLKAAQQDWLDNELQDLIEEKAQEQAQKEREKLEKLKQDTLSKLLS